MAHGHHHHNSSLRRAIRAQAGPEAYPYMRYSPTQFTPPEIGYAGPQYGGWFADALKKVGSVSKDAIGWAANTGVDYWDSEQQRKQEAEMNQAALDAQLEIARINAESNEKQKLMEYEFNVGGTKISAWTVAGIVGGVALLGGLTFFVLRRKK